MAGEKRPADGPSLEQYVETRLNLLGATIDKLEHSLRERIDAVESAGIARKAHLASEIAHAKQLLAQSQDTANRASDKAEKTQHDVNIAANEWRGTLNDFKGTLPTLSEFRQLRDDFGAYRLEQARLIAAGIKENTKEGKEDNKAMWAIVISIVSAALVFLSSYLKH